MHILQYGSINCTLLLFLISYLCCLAKCMLLFGRWLFFILLFLEWNQWTIYSWSSQSMSGNKNNFLVAWLNCFCVRTKRHHMTRQNGQIVKIMLRSVHFCVEQIMAGNWSNGFMTGRGYKNIAAKFELIRGLRHSKTQLKNRWESLKRLYSFWLWLNKQTGLGRANGTVVASEAFWKQHTKVYYMVLMCSLFMLLCWIYLPYCSFVCRDMLNGGS